MNCYICDGAHGHDSPPVCNTCRKTHGLKAPPPPKQKAPPPGYVSTYSGADCNFGAGYGGDCPKDNPCRAHGCSVAKCYCFAFDLG